VQILAHRGLWRAPEERNGLAALRRALELGFGLETDIRDHAGRLVISHDPPSGPAPLLDLKQVLELHAEVGAATTLAINIKADGLRGLLTADLADNAPNAFVFDMATPDALAYLAGPLPVFTRQSEYEPQPAFYDQAHGIWLDCFHRDWIDAEVVTRHRQAGKRVALVSPELHGRDPDAAWRVWSQIDHGEVMLCTDRPEAAAALFNAGAPR
jgi:hypothetical protein